MRSNMGWLHITIINGALLIILITVHVYLVRVFRKTQAIELVSSIRSDLIMGDRTDAFRILASRIGSQRGFVAIKLLEGHMEQPTLIGDRYGDRYSQLGIGNFLLYDNVDVLIHFDKEKTQEFGHLIFFYSRFSDSSFVLTLWVFLSVVVALIAIRQRKRMALDFEKQIVIRRNETIAQMTQMVSHDLRAPLGTFEALLATPDDRLHEMRDSVRDSLSRLYSMIESLRHSEIENLIRISKIQLDIQPATSGVRAKAVKRGISLEVDQAQGMTVMVDEMKFERAWINLVSNAIDFAHSMVKVEVESDETALLLRVIDDGPGVPEEILPRLFERGMTYGKTDGTGLGLAFARQIIRGHGGEITYYRDKSLTVFECRLPHAVLPKENEVMKSQSLGRFAESDVKQKVIAICLFPESLAKTVHAKLSCLKSRNFIFSSEYDSADIVVTNDPELALTAIDDNKDPIEINPNLSGEAIVERLVRRFDIIQGGVVHV